MKSEAISSRVWFITGCSTGFGRLLCEALLSGDDRVVATARNISQLDALKALAGPEKLLILKLDVTQKDQIEAAVKSAISHFGQIDILVNNAGYGSVGALEETSSEEIRRVFETNVFGLFEVTRAIIPQMRKQNSGHIINLSSVSGMVGLPGAGIYAATKFAVEGHSEALAGELAPFNIKVTLLEPGAFRTDFAGRSITVAPYSPVYDEALASTRKYYETIGGHQPGDPKRAVELMIKIANHPTPPLRLVMGKIALSRIHKKLDQYLSELNTWQSETLKTDYDEN